MTNSHGGRPKKPREVLALEGVTDKRRVNDDAPAVREEPPVVPPWVADLPNEVRDQWMKTWTHTCREAWWLKAADSVMLAQYVVAAVDAERLGRALLRSPILERDASTGGPKRLTVRREYLAAADAARRLAAEFGLTTTTRQNLRAADLGNDPNSAKLYPVSDIFDSF